MSTTNQHHVYHGSHESIELAIPRRNIRVNRQNETVFDDISFHATPERWIALAYTYLRGKDRPEDIREYNMGVSLFDDTDRRISIFGRQTLEHSLEQLYGRGGYLHHFKADDFIHTEGLGKLEVISQMPIKPIEIERIDDPVAELVKLGIGFDFVDLDKGKQLS